MGLQPGVKISIILARFAGFLGLFFAAFQAGADEVDNYIKAQMRRHGIPGLAVAVAREGILVKAEGYGLANVELGVPAGAETVFEIGSITKQFTAMLALLLVAENKLGLEDKLGSFFEGTPETWQDITLRHLLTHTSGLTNYTSLGGFEAGRKLNARRFVRALAPHPLVFPPGAAWSYCNSGYNLLGYVIEKATGKPYWENLRERILLPLGMSASRGRDPGTVITNRAAGYEIVNGKLTNRDSDLTDVFAAGAMASTVLDLVKWNAALDAGKLVPPALREQMWTPARLNNGQSYPYGFGWRLDNYKQWQCVSHSGSTAGFSASVQRYPLERLFVVVLCNLGKQNVATQVGRGVAELVIRPQVGTQIGR